MSFATNEYADYTASQKYLTGEWIFDFETGEIYDRRGRRLGSSLQEGYLCIGTTHHRRAVTVSVHRAMMIAWRGGRTFCPFETIDHINGNKQDNRICNLQTLTLHENTLKYRREAAAAREAKHRPSSSQMKEAFIVYRPSTIPDAEILRLRNRAKQYPKGSRERAALVGEYAARYHLSPRQIRHIIAGTRCRIHYIPRGTP